MKTSTILLSIVFPVAAFAQEVTTLTITNLSDKLHTRIEYDKSTGIDIRRMNLDSIHADKHKSRYTTVRDMSIKPLGPRKVLMVKPLMTKDEDGKNVHVGDIYVDTYAMRKLDTKNMLINAAKSSNMLVQDLSPNVFYLNEGKLSLIGTKSMSIDSLAPSSIDVKSISLDNIRPFIINVAGSDVNNLTVSSIYIDSGKISPLTISSLGLTDANVKKLEANLLAITKLNPTVINVTDSSSVSSIMVIDNSQFKVEVTEDTYAELAEMKLIYNFEQNYNESIKTEVKLNDVRQLDRKMYIKWIKMLAANKTSNIQLVKNRIRRKIVGEAWIYNDWYDSATKANMLKNLNFLKSKGYDHVLVRFDCSESIEKLSKMIDDIKEAGFGVFMCYVGQDNLQPRWNPFIDPETIKTYFKEIAPKCSGMLLNWRSTSNHVKILPIEFFNYLCNTVRKYNDQILIYGEVYYGRIDPLRMTTLIYTSPANITGLVINNMGYYGYNTTYIVNNLFATSVPGYKKLDKLGQVIGAGPYYCSRAEFDMHLNLEQEYSYKDKVETAFRRTGHGTVTMLHDGVDDNQTSLIADPKSKLWHDTTDNILYDTKIWKIAEDEARAKGAVQTASK